MNLFGEYYRQYFDLHGLLHSSGCADAASVSFLADSDQRTVATGRSLATGMFPGCTVAIRSLPGGRPYPLFHSLSAGVSHADHALAAAAVSGRIGNDPTGLAEAYAPALQDMEKILSACDTPVACNPEKRSLLSSASSVVAGKGDHLVDLRGPLDSAKTIAENFLLEYSDGMPINKVGWGRVDIAKINEFMTLHTAYSDLLQRTPYLARVQASNLMYHILATMQQARDQRKVAGALGKPGDKVVFLIGHDTNIAAVAGMLDISWIIDGRRDDTPPGGALVFELWTSPDTSKNTVHIYYLSQTLNQMRNLTALTLDTPPARANVFVPGCSSADREYSCQWSGFTHVVKSAIEPASVE